uniref:Uncharacterized protein n=2 Tax=Heterosigma akashiwo TaxID=2829 RepID=A0A7S3XPY0_HETAK
MELLLRMACLFPLRPELKREMAVKKPLRCVVVILLVFFEMLIPMLSGLHDTTGRMVDIKNRKQLPVYDMDTELELFYLERPFPFNVPDKISKKAGSIFENFGLAHAALGFREKNSTKATGGKMSRAKRRGVGYRFTLELYAPQFSGGFFPEVLNNLTLSWHNQGQIGLHKQTWGAGWTQAVYLTQISGVLFNRYADWLHEFVQVNRTLQPVTVCYNATPAAGGGEGEGGGPTCLSDAVNYSSPYSFVWESFRRMASLGAHITRDAPIQLQQTRLAYLAEEGAAARARAVPASLDVVEYYAELRACLNVAFFFSDDLANFALKAQACFPDTVYVNLLNDTYLPVKLTGEKITIMRKTVVLPSDKPKEDNEVNFGDVLVLIFLITILVFGSLVTYFHLSGNKYFNYPGHGRGRLRSISLGIVPDTKDYEKALLEDPWDDGSSSLNQKLISKKASSHIRIFSPPEEEEDQIINTNSFSINSSSTENEQKIQQAPTEIKTKNGGYSHQSQQSRSGPYDSSDDSYCCNSIDDDDNEEKICNSTSTDTIVN